MNASKIFFALALLAVGLCGCQPDTPANRTDETRQERREQRQAERQERRAERQGGEDGATGLNQPGWFGAIQSTFQNAHQSIRASFIRPRLRPERLQEQIFPLAIADSTTVTTRAGFRFTIPPNALVDAQGRPFAGAAVLAVREAMTVQDFIRAGLVTVAGQDPLMSGGMFHLSARDARTGKELRLAPGKTIKGETPVMDKPYDLYTGKITPDGGLDWVNPVPMIRLPEVGNTGELVGQESSRQIDNWVQRRIMPSTLVPISNELHQNLNYIRNTAIEFSSTPILRDLKYNRLSTASFQHRLAQLQIQLNATRSTPCANISEFENWQQERLSNYSPRFKFVWYQGRILLHRTVLGNLGFSSREFNHRNPQGVLRELPRALRKEYIDGTDLLPQLTKASRFFSQLVAMDSSETLLCQYVYKYALAAAPQLVFTDFNLQEAISLATDSTQNDVYYHKLLLINGKPYASYATLLEMGISVENLDNQYLYSLIQAIATRQNSPVLSSEALYNYLLRQPSSCLWAGGVRSTVTKRSYYYATQDSFKCWMATLDNKLEFEWIDPFQSGQGRDLNAAVGRRFGFTLQSFIWCNLDHLITMPFRDAEVFVDLPEGFSPENTQLYIVYPAWQAVFSFGYRNKQSTQIRAVSTIGGYALLVSGENAVQERLVPGQTTRIGQNLPRPLDQLFTSAAPPR